MRFRYTEWNGEEFADQAHLRLFDQFMEFVLEYGDEALESLEQMEMNEEQRELLEKLIEEGLLEKIGARWRLTPRAVNAMQRKALMEVFKRLRKGYKDGHDTPEAGQGGERVEGTKPYQFGDPVSELELSATLRNAIKRVGPGLPLKVGEADFELHQSEHHTSCSTVILLDSGAAVLAGIESLARAPALVALAPRRRWANGRPRGLRSFSVTVSIQGHDSVALPREQRPPMSLDTVDDRPMGR